MRSLSIRKKKSASAFMKVAQCTNGSSNNSFLAIKIIIIMDCYKLAPANIYQYRIGITKISLRSIVFRLHNGADLRLSG